jgi:crossover junction endodeoxyribonuclease RuvC
LPALGTFCGEEVVFMARKIVRILGIDPGLSNTGWGIVDTRGAEIRAVGCGGVTTPKDVDMGLRLRLIYNGLCEVVADYQPEYAAVEALFFARNVKSAMVVAQARGVAILAATSGGAEFCEYTPLQIKQAVVGRGRATKQQVELMVQTIGKLPQPPPHDHAADALAAAICHANFIKLGR